MDYDDLFSNDAESPALQLFLLGLEVVVSWQGLVGQTLLEELMPRIRIYNLYSYQNGFKSYCHIIIS